MGAADWNAWTTRQFRDPCRPQRANLSGANLFKAFLNRANLEAMDLRDLGFKGDNRLRRTTNLGGANLGEANLSGANLYGADLTAADLRDADLTVVTLVKGSQH